MKYKVKRLIVFILLVMVTVSSVTLYVSAKGTGTETDPYLIYTLKDLEDFRDSVNAGNTYEGKYVKLMDDITMNNPDMFARDEYGNITGAANGKTPYEWIPIGNENNHFCGSFDGNGHKIIGIYIFYQR